MRNIWSIVGFRILYGLLVFMVPAGGSWAQTMELPVFSADAGVWNKGADGANGTGDNGLLNFIDPVKAAAPSPASMNFGSDFLSPSIWQNAQGWQEHGEVPPVLRITR